MNNRDALELFISALNEWRELERFDMAAVAEASLRDISLRESGIRGLGRVEAIGDLLAYVNHIKRSEQ